VGLLILNLWDLQTNFQFNLNFISGCDSYVYDKTWYESTIPSSNNWVCDDEIYVANAFAYSKIGEVIGSIVFGWFGDV
jgi:hypothetical protein